MPTNNDYCGGQTQAPSNAGQQAQWAQPAPAAAQGQQVATGYAAQAQPNAAGASPYANAAPYVPDPAGQPTKSRGWIVAIVVVVCLFLLFAFGIYSCTSTFSSLGSNSGAGNVVDGDAIAFIELDGTIQYDGTACSPEGLKELLDIAEEDDDIKAVVLRVNSGGGTATAGEEMAEYVRQFAESKPIVVSSASINASAAYEISSQADYIFVAKSTEIGAIGTAMELTDISGLLDMLGVSMEVITSADEKDSSYGYRPLTDGERAAYQAMVDQINGVFLENVAAGRDMTMDEVRALATGMPFTGIDAVQNGLADEIGTREDAVEKAAELAGISDYTTTDLSLTSYDLSSLAYLLGEDQSSAERLLKVLEDASNGIRIK